MVVVRQVRSEAHLDRLVPGVVAHRAGEAVPSPPWTPVVLGCPVLVNTPFCFESEFTALSTPLNPAATRITEGGVDVQARSCCASGGCCASGAGGPSLWTTQRTAWRGLHHREALRHHNNPHRTLCVPVCLLLPM